MKKEEVTSILEKNSVKIRSFHVRALYVFGSVVRGEAIETSDVDLLVEFDPDARIGLFEFARLQRMLAEILGCEVDLATTDSLHKALRARILGEAVHAI
ncbi:MAG TPA: nucleotidyltransferase [Nitrospiraceae bacterium]|jgi:predicted nucleotidyltransferase|nr:nucleotidyltransferase [Nitrospiraceae bacterium]